MLIYGVLITEHVLSTKKLLPPSAPTGNHQRNAPVTERVGPNFLRSQGVGHTRWSGGCPCQLSPYLNQLHPHLPHPLYGYRLKTATFANRYHVMQPERYNFFEEAAFTLKITLTGSAHISQWTLIRVSLIRFCECAPYLHQPNRNLSFLSNAYGLSSPKSSTMPPPKFLSKP